MRTLSDGKAYWLEIWIGLDIFIGLRMLAANLSGIDRHRYNIERAADCKAGFCIRS
ncbi:hypothetical protein DSUL_50185 [Desulfovibrionales bacterium]